MNRLKNILVGVDFSSCSKAVLSQAAQLAKWNNARLHIIHVRKSVVVNELAGAFTRSHIELREITIVHATEKFQREERTSAFGQTGSTPFWNEQRVWNPNSHRAPACLDAYDAAVRRDYSKLPGTSNLSVRQNLVPLKR